MAGVTTKWRAKTDARTVTHRDFPLRAQTRLAANRNLGRVNSPLSTVAALKHDYAHHHRAVVYETRGYTACNLRSDVFPLCAHARVRHVLHWVVGLTITNSAAASPAR